MFHSHRKSQKTKKKKVLHTLLLFGEAVTVNTINPQNDSHFSSEYFNSEAYQGNGLLFD